MSYRTFLIGGGWWPAAAAAVYGPVLTAASSRAAAGTPTVGCVVVDEGDGFEQFARWSATLTRTAACTPLPILVPVGDVLDVRFLERCHGILVCGGLTPAYAAALTPARARLQDLLLGNDIPYAGFSAGSVIAAPRALVGGWLDAGVPVCSPDAAEDLEELTVTDGLGLVPFAVDVHAAQWGTLPRLIAAVRRGLVGYGVAIDENTVLATSTNTAQIFGIGRVHVVRSGGDDGSVLVTSLGSGPINLFGGSEG
jgi:cyanophycinase